MDRGRRRRRLQGTVEVRQPSLRRRAPSDRQRHQPHAHRPAFRHHLHGARHRHARPRRGRHALGHRHRHPHARAAGSGAVRHGHPGRRPALGLLDGRGERDRLQGAVEVRQPSLRRQPPSDRQRHQPHHHRPDRRHRLYRAGDRHAHPRRGRPAFGRSERRGEKGATGRADGCRREGRGGWGGCGMERGGRRGRLQGAVEVRLAGVERHAPARPHLERHRYLHHHRPQARHRIHRARDRHLGARGRQPAILDSVRPGGLRRYHGILADDHAGDRFPRALVAIREDRDTRSDGLPGGMETRHGSGLRRDGLCPPHHGLPHQHIHHYPPDGRHGVRRESDAAHRQRRSVVGRLRRVGHDAQRRPRATHRHRHARRPQSRAVVGRADRRGRLQGAVEDRLAGVGRHAPVRPHHLDHHQYLHHHRPHARHRIYGAGDRHARPRRGRHAFGNRRPQGAGRTARPGGDRHRHARHRLAGPLLERRGERHGL